MCTVAVLITLYDSKQSYKIYFFFNCKHLTKSLEMWKIDKNSTEIKGVCQETNIINMKLLTVTKYKAKFLKTLPKPTSIFIVRYEYIKVVEAT